MTKPRKPAAPADLGRRARAFWRRATAVYELSEVEVELLREICRMVDECEQLKGALDTDGTTVPGSSGQPRVHPALGELRGHRLALGKLLAQLDLPDETGDALATPTQARARRAADVRWRAHREARAVHSGRRRSPAAVGPESSDLVLPARLVRGLRLPIAADEFAKFHRERNAWFRAHGIDPLDWRRVYPVLQASDTAHGVESRPRRRLRLRAAEYEGPDRG